ncbi:MAG: PaaI family thioesterase [Saccharofermentans sp.]|nr:PaaI family thioesterase [Mageeibacillus sp.]MCI1263874.1 PaaI family thioesterase [Saccharofermentans sp.]MCI1275197.1 PaaI family thioesterase [Saccharofermentans sp.]MCI2043776.1 PaaI family thioesterase [Mageeibacillus sp.]
MAAIEEVREFFRGDRYATEVTGICIDEAKYGHSKVTLEPCSKHMNAAGGLMGAVYYTMADFAFAVAQNCEPGGNTMTVTQSSQINFLRPWKCGEIICTADIVKDGRSTCVYEVKIYDGQGRQLVLAVMNGYKVSRQ